MHTDLTEVLKIVTELSSIKLKTFFD